MRFGKDFNNLIFSISYSIQAYGCLQEFCFSRTIRNSGISRKLPAQSFDAFDTPKNLKNFLVNMIDLRSPRTKMFFIFHQP